MSLHGTKTHENLKEAFAGESQANRRYLYFAQKADVEGYNDVAAVFRSTAEGETGHAHGHSHAHSHASGDTPFGKPGNPKMKAQTIELRMMENNGAMAFEPNEIKLKKGEQVRLRLANADVVPYDYVEFARTMRSYLRPIDDNLKAKGWRGSSAT